MASNGNTINSGGGAHRTASTTTRSKKTTSWTSSLTSSSSSLGIPPYRANVLILVLSVGIVVWILLCFHIHLKLSGSNDGGSGISHLGFVRRGKLSLASSTNNNNNNKYPTTSNKEEGLSACLLVNDENPRLPEWIAYHYQILPLRGLIVAVDPASRLSPASILNRWTRLKEELGLEILLWNREDYYMPYGGDGACNMTDPKANCLGQHRKRQQHFVRACMANFKQRNKTWVLLADVDEYITFNTIHNTDPPAPLDNAPEGVWTLANWKWTIRGYNDPKTHEFLHETVVGGTISGLPTEGYHGKMNGDNKTTLGLINKNDEIFYGAYGSIFTDTSGAKYFLRDDYAYRDALDVPLEEVPANVSIVKDGIVRGNKLHGTIDGESVEIPTNWREPSDVHFLHQIQPSNRIEIKTIHGGHMMKDLNGRKYYVQRDIMLWPPHLSTQQLLNIRMNLPTVSDGKTIHDVLNEVMSSVEPEYANETVGPCLSLPRLLYGSKVDPPPLSVAPEGFNDHDFVTLRYRWHSLPDNRVNKYSKTMIDLSRLDRRELKGEAQNIHAPVKYYCREKQPPRYTTSFFRLNHYLDSFEAYSYRNDARADKRRCKKCYDDKGKEASKQFDDDIRPWLKRFVENVGVAKAKVLLAGAGNFVDLSPYSNALFTGGALIIPTQEPMPSTEPTPSEQNYVF